MLRGQERTVEELLRNVKAIPHVDLEKEFYFISSQNVFERIFWFLLFFFLVVTSLFSSSFGLYFFYIYKTENEFLSLVEGYDGGHFLICITLNCSIVSMGNLFCLSFFFVSKNRIILKGGNHIFRSYLSWFSSIIFTVSCLFFASINLYYYFDKFFPNSGIESSMEKYLKKNEAKSSLDKMHMTYRCCGNNNLKDWFYIKLADQTHSTDISIPQSCCKFSNCTHLVPW